MIKAFYFMIWAVFWVLKCQYVLNLLLKSIKAPKYLWSKFDYKSIRKKLKQIALFVKLHSNIYLFIYLFIYSAYLHQTFQIIYKVEKTYNKCKLIVNVNL